MHRARTISTSIAAAAALAAACGGSSSVSLTQIAPGAHDCPTGGVLISDGQTAQVVCNGSTQPTATTILPGDKDCPAGGVLIDAPPAQPQKVCSAPGGIVARSTSLAPGDIHCASGGVMVEFSSVPPGSTTFDPTNIISTQFLCNPTVTPIGSLVAPGGAAGSATLVTRGGDGTSGAGGTGGNVSLSMAAGSLSGHVKIWKTGTAAAGVAMPAAPASLDFGPVKLDIASNQQVTVAAGTSDTCASAGLYTFAVTEGTTTVPRIRSCLGANSTPLTVTGISVAKGGRLFFDATPCTAEGAFPATACAKATIALACVNAGVIAVNPGASTAPPRLALTCGSFRGESTSSIAVPAGGFAGVKSTGALHNAGLIDVSQGSGAIDLAADLGLVSTGTLLATGASGIAGGAGGAIRLSGGVAGVAVSGVLDTSGASGPAGGAAGPVSITVSSGGGALRTEASIRAAGGPGRGTAGCAGTTACDGGAGGAVRLDGLNGDVVISGPITTAGGASLGGNGGAGGAVTIGTVTGAAPQTGGNTIATGSIWISGAIDASGGDGADSGGAGGAVAVSLDPGTAPAGQEIVLFGFGGKSPKSAASGLDVSVDASGGDGGASGGGGAAVTLSQDASFLNGGTAPAGAVLNATNVAASGGQATGPGGLGGAGGTIALQTQSKNAFPGQASEFAINSGALTANGGSGAAGGDATSAAAAGAAAIRLYGRTGVQNSGTLAASGGVATAASAGVGGSIVLASDAGPVENTAGVRADGGAATTGGANNLAGDGGAVQLTGATVKNGAQISANGGDATASDGGAGNGGAIRMTGATSSVVTSGALTVNGGKSATTTALTGTILIDGVLVPGGP